MEQALFISKPAHLSYYTEEFSRLYFGNEFCERLLPAAEELRQALAFASQKHLRFSLVTPYATNRGLEQIERLIAEVSHHVADAEVVFNDWGVLHCVRQEYPGLMPVLGRLLNKSKRGPRIMNILEQTPPATQAYYQGSNLDVPAAVRFLKALGVSRVEFDNLLQGTQLAQTDQAIHKSLYMPFAYVSTTRFCLSANCDNPRLRERVGVVPCGRECQKYTFSLANPVMGLPLIRKGNAVFFVNEDIPDSVAQHLFDRIVIEPEIPL